MRIQVTVQCESLLRSLLSTQRPGLLPGPAERSHVSIIPFIPLHTICGKHSRILDSFLELELEPYAFDCGAVFRRRILKPITAGIVLWYPLWLFAGGKFLTAMFPLLVALILVQCSSANMGLQAGM